jgi:hypothetical protein
LLTAEVVAFLHGGVVAIVGTASADLAPALTRAFAPRVAPDHRTIDVFVGRDQSTTCLANLVAGASISVIVGNPVDYRGIQIKGAFAGQRAVDDRDAAWLERCLDLYLEALARVGIPPAHSRRLLSRRMVCITLIPTEIFRQTPGPGAGAPLAAGPRWT